MRTTLSGLLLILVVGSVPVPLRGLQPQRKPAAPRPVVPLRVLKHRWEAVSVAFSPDGKLLAAGSGYNGIILWEAATGKEMRWLQGDQVGDNIVFAPAGKTLIATRNWRQQQGGGAVQFWDTGTGKLLRTIDNERQLVRCAALSPDGKTLATHSQFDAVRLRDTATAKELFSIPTNGAGHTVAISPDGQLLAFDVGGTVRLAEAATGREVRRLDSDPGLVNNGRRALEILNELAFSPNGQLLAAGGCDQMARIWDVKTGKLLQVLEGHRGFVNTVVFLRDSQTLCSGGEDGTIRLWSAGTGQQLRQLQAHGSSRRADGDTRKDVFSLALSPDGKQLASGGRDTLVQVWEVGSLLQER